MTTAALAGTASFHFVTKVSRACVLGINGKVQVGGGCSCSLCEESQGLLHARHSLFQSAPMDPSQDTDEPLMVAPWGNLFNKGKTERRRE